MPEQTVVDIAIALLTLTAMEVVLGIDNIVFIAILTDRLPPGQRPKARRIGLSLALVLRVGLLLGISWVMKLTAPLFEVLGKPISGRDIILLAGGLFLVGKATFEIYEKLEVPAHDEAKVSARSYGKIIAQIVVLDMVFSLDSVITAVGMVKEPWIMITAMMVAIGVMLVFVSRISDFVNRHPSMKVLALAFLILIGVMLVAEGMHEHIPRGYIYFAMAFSLGIEFLNMRLRKVSVPVQLHQPYDEKETQHALQGLPMAQKGTEPTEKK
jgi:predicted tellurium resistance membrane protein TerC